MKTVLLVDDDATYLRVLANAFIKKGYEVRISENAESALRIAKTFFPEWVVLDLKMPGATGLSLIPKLKELEPLVKILVLTGYANVSTAVEATKLGAHYYLAKPANLEQILKAFGKNKADPNTPVALMPTLTELEKQHIQAALSRNQGNISAAAKELGLHRRTLQRKLEKIKN